MVGSGQFMNENSIFISTNNGSNWESILVVNDPFVWKCIIDTGRFIFISSIQNGLFRSSDFGLTWIHIDPIINGCGLGYGAISSLPYGTLFAGCRDSSYRSTDRGSSWSPFFQHQQVSPGLYHMIVKDTYGDLYATYGGFGSANGATAIYRA